MLYGTIAGLLALVSSAPAEGQEPAALIPRPAEVTWQPGEVQLKETTRIAFAQPEARDEAETLAALLRPATGLPLPVGPMPAGSAQQSGLILLGIDGGAQSESGAEGYRLEVSPGPLIRITGAKAAGLFYGGQTLRQLLPAAIYATTPQASVNWKVPCCHIEDQPRFRWRGLLLDDCRYFFGKEYVMRMIDRMAVHKLNTLQWHLADDQGWRIEIKKYPKLTEIGAWRNETMGDGQRYGGFYTQDEIREVVAYAARRHVNIVPEIEMPGHSLAVLTAYPELSCSGGPFQVRTTWGIEESVYCAGNDATFVFLRNVLDELLALFPSPYIHVGGAECPKVHWKECPKCQARIRSEGLKDEEELQGYFTRTIHNYLASKGRRPVGWDEILAANVPPNATVMSWRGMDGARKAAELDHDYVATPKTHCYLNYPTIRISLEKAYSFDPIPDTLSEAQQARCLGLQGNMWSEYTSTAADLDRQVWPRLCALAEAAWTPKPMRDWKDFTNRVARHAARLDALGIILPGEKWRELP